MATTSNPQSVVLTDTGDGVLTITGVTVSGDFLQSNNCGTNVAAGKSCTILVTFTPTATGIRNGALTITDNAAGSPQSVSLSGSGASTDPSVTLSSPSLIFVGRAVGATSAAQSITLSNTGSAALSISSIGLTGVNPGDFAQTNNCPSSLATGSSCTLSVTFTPAVNGTLTAALNIADNAPGSPQSVSLSGSEASAGPSASLLPSSLTFADEGVGIVSLPQTVTLTNTGSVSLNITSIAFTGINATDFTQMNTCNSLVVVGRTCTILVLFMPSFNGAAAASLSVTDNATGSPQSVMLTGTGGHDVVLSWTASATSGVAGYNVYRGIISGGEDPIPLNPTPIAGTSYTDANVVAGVTYYYVLTSVASDGVTQSLPSSETVVTVPLL